MIDPTLAAFFESPVMIIFGTRSAAGRPAIGRGLGARVSAGGREVEFYAGGRQWAEALEGLCVGAPVAVTFCRPADYRAFQLKGPVLAMGPASQADMERSTTYAEAMNQVLKGLGVTDAQIERWLRPERLVTLRLQVAELFAQTPGPGAGEQLAGAAP